MLDVPLLIIGFNRPKEITDLLNLVKQHQPSKIYFAIDGPRSDRENEIELVNKVKKIVQSVDWCPEVYFKFEANNLGCRLGVQSAITWVFSKEEEAIILEDDIRPNESFFKFCTELLDLYKKNNQVLGISGSNFYPNTNQVSSYRFSTVTHVWGWATWRRAWLEYESNLSNWREEIGVKGIRDHFECSWLNAIAIGRIFSLVANNKIDTWDYQLLYTAIKKNMVTATSNSNLTDNAGFSSTATHTIKPPNYLLPAIELQFPLKHPEVQRDKVADLWLLKNAYGVNFAHIVRYFITQIRKLIP